VQSPKAYQKNSQVSRVLRGRQPLSGAVKEGGFRRERTLASE